MRIKIGVVLLLLFSSPGWSQVHKIKFASLAPEGSTWLNVMKEYDEAIRQESNGQIGFKIYSGGIMGDEKTVLRKIRLGQLHSGGFTGVGLGEILPEVRIFDSPFFFRNYEEVDYITQKFSDRFAKAFEAKGYVLLGWAEVGFVYVFTNTPIQQKSEMSRVKMWMWESDPVARATFEALGISAKPLSVIEVMTALQTGMIDGVYTSPLAIIGLQWFTKVKFMLQLPLANAAGAVLLSKAQFDDLAPESQEILLRNARLYFDKLKKLSREDNEKSIETLKRQGIQMTTLAQAENLQSFYEAGKSARQIMANELYSKTLLDEMEQALQEFRQQPK
jgi:TRAP-type C4-dicarboxylate transport system substrate-binding protein